MILRELLVRMGFQVDKRGADEANRTIDGLKRAGQTLAQAFAFKKIFDGVTNALDQAAGASDRLNVLNKTFKDQSAFVVGWTEMTADALGRSKYSLQEYAASFGSLLVPAMKGNVAQAAEMSTSLAKLSVDLGSFFHMADDEVLWRLRSGMLGSTIAVDNLGIELHETALKQFYLDNKTELAAKGIKSYSKAMDPAQKMLLRYAKIMRDASNAHGFAADTAKEYDNRLRKLKETLKSMTIDIGMQLIPVGSRVVEMLGNWATKTNEAIRGSNALGAAMLVLGGYFSLLAAQWALANVPLLITIAFLGLLFLAVEDLYTGLQGGDSYIKDWFESLAGKDAWEDVIRTWKTGKKALDAILAGDWQTLENLIFDFANPNATANDAWRSGMVAYSEAAKNTTRGVNKATRNQGRALLDRGQWFNNIDTMGGNVTGPGGLRAGVGPIAGGGTYNAGPVVVNIHGNATPATAREVGRAAQAALENQNRDMYKSTGRFNFTQGGTGQKYAGEVWTGAAGPER